MNLSQPVTIQQPSVTRPDGQIRSFKPITISSLDFMLIDSPHNKSVMARVMFFPIPVVLWQGAEYDSAGDYTQAQAEARLLEKLGPDLKVGLENLFPKPAAQ